ncbi:type II toxin-antitoxin system VapC family toxin [soil metagenome]
MWLLDTNLLIAMLWPTHALHEQAQEWSRAQQQVQWATCPFTQSGFVRILSNPAFSSDAVSPAEATERLSANLSSPRHRFLPASISFAQAVALLGSALQGHRQVTDAYLLGLAVHHQVCLATFDRSIEALAAYRNPEVVQVIGS